MPFPHQASLKQRSIVLKTIATAITQMLSTLIDGNYSTFFAKNILYFLQSNRQTDRLDFEVIVLHQNRHAIRTASDSFEEWMGTLYLVSIEFAIGIINSKTL